jgi:hypothetical protein
MHDLAHRKEMQISSWYRNGDGMMREWKQDLLPKMFSLFAHPSPAQDNKEQGVKDYALYILPQIYPKVAHIYMPFWEIKAK